MSFSDAYDALREFDLNKQPKKKKEKKEEPPIEEKKPPMEEKTTKCEEMRKEVINYDIPSRQYGDLYCLLCDSHMNSDQIWESHIKGKRHLKMARKGDTADTKYEYCEAEPTIQKELDQETRPLAGLDHICEMLRINQPPVYQCFLCSASITTTKMLMEHILGTKHQKAFLKEHDKEKFALVDASSLSKSCLEPIVQDLISKYESEHGRGRMSVKKEKEKAGSSWKRSSDVGATSLKSSGYSSAPKASKSSSRTKSSKFSPPPKSARYSPPPKSARYSSPSPPPRSSRYSPPSKSSRYSPPSKSARYLSPSPPPRSARYLSPSPPPKSARYSPPAKSARMRERNLDSEWQRVSPVRGRSNERRYSDRSHYSQDEKWAKIEPESTFYRRVASNQDSDSRFERANNSSRTWVSPDPVNCSDLRDVLEQKKNLGMSSAYARPNVDRSAASSEINISDSILRLIEDMSPEAFLYLALFKLDNMQIQELKELKALDRVAKKATAMTDEIKQSLQSTELKAKYQETSAQNGISHQSMLDTSQNNPQFNQNLDSLIGHYKARKTTVYDDVSPKDSYSNRLIASEQYIGNGSSHHPLNTSSHCRNTSETATSFDSGWNQRSSTSLPFQSFSSTPTNIPGLTLTEDPPAQTSTAMSQFAQTAQNIFGNINVPSAPSNPYKNEDYNRLNYRY